MKIEEFCVKLSSLSFDNTKRALAIIWFFNVKEQRTSCTAGELARHIRDSGLGNPNSTRLRDSLLKSGHVLRSGDRIRLKPTSYKRIEAELASLLDPETPEVPTSEEFLSTAVWRGSRGYIEKIAAQINGSYHCTYYDGASVLCRKLVEILLIEAFEYSGKEQEIRDGNGDYFMLSKLIDITLGPNGFTLGRETKKVLREVKAIGDRSAHNRRYIAVKSDLDDLRSGYRLLVDELLHLSGIK